MTSVTVISLHVSIREFGLYELPTVAAALLEPDVNTDAFVLHRTLQ